MRGTDMPMVALSATPKGNGYQATVTFPDGVAMSSAETYPTIAEAVTGSGEAARHARATRGAGSVRNTYCLLSSATCCAVPERLSLYAKAQLKTGEFSRSVEPCVLAADTDGAQECKTGWVVVTS
jgi:hypothetical protein